MKLLIVRKYLPSETKGIMLVINEADLLYHGVSLEPPNNGNQVDHSCILEGTYETIKYKSPTKGWVFLLLNVPGRTEIEIHVLNYAAGDKVETKGCIGPGLYFDDLNADGFTDIVESRQALNKLMKLLPEKFYTTIIS